MQVPSQKFYRTSGRLDSATASGDAMTSRFVEGSLESVPPDLCPRQLCQGFYIQCAYMYFQKFIGIHGRLTHGCRALLEYMDEGQFLFTFFSPVCSTNSLLLDIGTRP